MLTSSANQRKHSVCLKNSSGKHAKIGHQDIARDVWVRNAYADYMKYIENNDYQHGQRDHDVCHIAFIVQESEQSRTHHNDSGYYAKYILYY